MIYIHIYCYIYVDDYIYINIAQSYFRIVRDDKNFSTSSFDLSYIYEYIKKIVSKTYDIKRICYFMCI
jgi:hypothetical protein